MHFCNNRTGVGDLYNNSGLFLYSGIAVYLSSPSYHGEKFSMLIQF